jgi:hypothetical protein
MHLLAVVDVGGKMLAFINLISLDRDEITGDLMRRRGNTPSGIMDYLFFELLQHAKERGYGKVSLGLAPMTGFQEGERATVEERAIHFFVQKLDFLFSFRGRDRTFFLTSLLIELIDAETSQMKSWWWITESVFASSVRKSPEQGDGERPHWCGLSPATQRSYSGQFGEP